MKEPKKSTRQLYRRPETDCRCSTLYWEPDFTHIESEEEFRALVESASKDDASRDWIIGSERGWKVFDILNKQGFDFENGIILDLGSGFGGLSLFLSNQTKEVVSLDINKRLLCIAHRRKGFLKRSNVHTMLGNAVKIPLKSESLDLALIIGVLEWVPSSDSKRNPEDLQLETLKGVHKVLKKNGMLLLAIENRYYLGYWLGRKDHHTGLRFVPVLPRRFADLISKAIKGESYLNWTPSYSTLSCMLQNAGFTILKAYVGIQSYTSPKEVADINNRSEIMEKLDSAGLGKVDRILWKTINSFGLMKTLSGNFIFLCSKTR